MGDFYVIGTSEQLLARIGPDVWQGNADVFPAEGALRVGHFWSALLMLSPGKWLTDKVESEGLKLEYFGVLADSGTVIQYEGTWRFRDYFTTKARHSVWSDQEYVYHLVRARLDIMTSIDDVGAVWVELMNDGDAYTYVITKTKSGLIRRGAPGRTKKHYLDEYLLDNGGWIAMYGARKGQSGSPALVLLTASQPVRPRQWDCNTDNIELHLLDPKLARNLNPGAPLELEYMLIISPDPDSYVWIDEAVTQARQLVETLKP
jgi:hypothetical protein